MYPGPIVYRGRIQTAGSIHYSAHHFRAPGSANPNTSRRVEMNAWCEEYLGPVSYFEYPNDSRGLGRWYRTGSNWIIYSDDDALAFRMRWC
jgi:hypothetical protein